MCALEAPDLTEMIPAAFGDQVLVRLVNAGESLAAVMDYAQDTGVGLPILVDAPLDACYAPPASDPSAYTHFLQRVGDPLQDPPFPMHVVIDGDGVMTYLRRAHQPDELLSHLATLVTDIP